MIDLDYQTIFLYCPQKLNVSKIGDDYSIVEIRSVRFAPFVAEPLHHVAYPSKDSCTPDKWWAF